MRKLNRFWMLITVVMITVVAYAQDVPPPPPPANHGNEGNSQGAPIDGGLGILLALGAAYGGKKVYHLWKDQQKEKTPVEEKEET